MASQEGGIASLGDGTTPFGEGIASWKDNIAS